MARLLPGMQRRIVPVGATGDDDGGVDWALHDDPPAGGAGGREGRRALLPEVVRQGDDTLLDGEGGDELFEIAVSWRDLLREGSRAKAARLYLTDPRWGTKALLVALENAVHSRRRVRPRDPRRHGLPGWLTEAFWRSTPCQEAFAADRTRRSEKEYGRRLDAVITSAAFVGRQAAERLDGRCVGVQVHSPLIDPAVVALACEAPAGARVQHGAPKALLRSVARGRIPESLIVAREDLFGYASMLRHGLAGVSWDAVSAAVEAAPVVGEWVDLRVLERQFLQRQAMNVCEAEALYLLVQGVLWMAMVRELPPS